MQPTFATPLSTADDVASVVGTFVGGSLALALVCSFYFLPAIIAATRKHNSVLPIFIVNLLLGWSFFGWVIPLIWACTGEAKSKSCGIPGESLPVQGHGETDAEYLIRIKRLHAA